jgi:hypothetical protein
VSLNPPTLLAKLDADAAALDVAGKELAHAIGDAAKAAANYERAMQSALLELRDEHAKSGERMPAEDLRRAMAHQRIDRKLYGEHLTAQARVEGGKAYLRALTAAVSARQSVLSALRAEAAVDQQGRHLERAA